MPSPYQPCFQRRIKKKGKQRRPDENGVVKKRKAIQTETAPHILAALQAQRERVAQQQANDSGCGGDKSDDNTFAFLKRQQRPQQQTSLPGFLFDKEHGRFFKLVRGGAAHPAQVSATQRPARGLPNLGESRALAGGAPKVSPAEGGRVGHDAIRKRGQGLHAYVVHRRTGWFGDSSWNPRAAGVARGGWRRAAVESVACSSRFQAKQSLRLSCDNDVCTIAYNPEREMVAFGSSSGRVCLLTPRDHGSIYSSDGPRVIREYGSEDMVQWSQANGYGQVSDISFAEYDKGCCYAFSWLGSAGRPGQVRAYFPRTQSDGDGAGVPLESTRQPSHHEVHIEVGRGSAWCAEYDPRSPARLAIGTSTVFPVSMYNTERSHLEPIAKLSSDVFSISFAPPDAPGAGDAIALGLRNGTVRLLDPRKPWHGGRPTDVLARLGSSIDHVRMLRDGRRCLIRDQSGGLQMYDVRVPEREPLRVLVPSNPGRMRPFCRGKFVLDPSETVVASPVGRRVGSTAVVGRGEGAEPTGVAQGEDTSMCPFVRNPRRRYVRPPRSDQTQSHRVEVGAPVIDGRESATLREEAKGERVRLLSLTTGGILSDLATPWDRLSVARGVTGASGACHSEGDFCFLGIGSGSGDGGQARVFEARLWPEVDSGADAQ